MPELKRLSGLTRVVIRIVMIGLGAVAGLMCAIFVGFLTHLADPQDYMAPGLMGVFSAHLLVPFGMVLGNSYAQRALNELDPVRPDAGMNQINTPSWRKNDERRANESDRGTIHPSIYPDFRSRVAFVKAIPFKKHSFPILVCVFIGLVNLGLAVRGYVSRWPNTDDLVWDQTLPEPAFTWQRHWTDAEKVSKEQNKPLLVFFCASWASTSEKMQREVWTDPAVGKVVNANYVPLYVDINDEEHAEKVAEFKVRKLPYIVVLDSSGSIVRHAFSMSTTETLWFLR